MARVARGSLALSGAFFGSRCAGDFLRWSLILGTLYSLINPPFTVNDERHHFPRLHELSEGILISRAEDGQQYNLVPRAYEIMFKRYGPVSRSPDARIKLRRLGRDFIDRHGFDRQVQVSSRASDYTPIAYLPQFPAMYLSRWLHLPTLPSAYLIRLSSVLACSLIAACAVALAGPLRWAFFALGLMPMFVTQMAGVSGDGMTNALALLFFALLAKGTFAAPLPRKELALLLALSALLVCCKPPYALLALAMISLRAEGTHPWLRRAALVGSALAIDAALLVGWRLLLSRVQVNQGGEYDTQLAALRADPLALPRVILESLFANLDDLTIQVIAFRDLISSQLRFMGGVLSVLYLQLLICLALGVHARADRTALRSLRAALLAIAAGCTGAFYLVMFLSATRPGSNLISGVQGRYFLPLMPMLLLALASYGRPTLSRWFAQGGTRRVLVPILACNALCLLCLCARYYLSSHVDWPY